MTTNTTIIGILTIIMATVSFYFVPYRFLVIGTWGIFDVGISWFFFITYFVYYGMVMSVAALVIGIATLRKLKWTWKTNFIFQIVSIGVLLVNLIAEGFSGSSDAVTFNRELSLILAFTVLYLLLKPSTRAYYRTLASHDPRP